MTAVQALFNRKLIAVLLTAIVVTGGGAAAAPATVLTNPAQQTDNPFTSLSVQPEAKALEVGETTTFDIVVDTVDGGVGAYNFTVNLTEGSVARITDVEFRGEPSKTETVASSSSSITISAADADTVDSGSVTILTVTVEGVADGYTALEFESNSLETEGGVPYDADTLVSDGYASIAVGNPEEGESVSLSPPNATITIGETTTFDIEVEDIESVATLGSYNITVTLDNESVGRITTVSLWGNPSEVRRSSDTSVTVVVGPNSSVREEFRNPEAPDPDSIKLLTVTVEGVTEGTTNVDVDGTSLRGQFGIRSPLPGEDATLTVGEEVEEPSAVCNGCGRPTDVDGDGLYEDVNGNGELNIVDVQALFANAQDSAVQDDVDAFDFNGDGEVDVVDVQALFVESGTS